MAGDVDRRHEARECLKSILGTQTGIQPLHLARIDDLRHGDLVKVDCAACRHVALLTRNFCCGSGLALGPRGSNW
jgi:hypothetical protein